MDFYKIFLLQELQNNQMKNVKNNINITNTNLSRSQTPHLKNPESEIQYDSTPLVSQCPLCFGLYPTSDIEVNNIFFFSLVSAFKTISLNTVWSINSIFSFVCITTSFKYQVFSKFEYKL